MQGGKRPTKNQQDFQDWLRRNYEGCQNCVAPAEELHHILGSSAKVMGVNIGQWACTMLCSKCNQDNLRLPPKDEQLRNFVRGPLKDYYTRFDELPLGMTARELFGIMSWSR